MSVSVGFGIFDMLGMFSMVKSWPGDGCLHVFIISIDLIYGMQDWMIPEFGGIFGMFDMS